VVLSHGRVGRGYQRCSYGGADGATAAAQAGDLVVLSLPESLRAWVVAEERGGSLTVEGAHDLCELRKNQDQEAVNLPEAIREVLTESPLQVHELAEVVQDGIWWRSGFGPSQGSEASDGECVGPVGLRAAQVFLGEAPDPRGPAFATSSSHGVFSSSGDTVAEAGRG